MVDTLTPAERSMRMGRIRARDTKPEVALRKALHAKGLRFRLHGAKLPGKPDIVLPKYKAVIFVHGCFWHRHKGCKVASTPKTNTEFWVDKFDKNVARDARNIAFLLEQGWHVLVVWECELSTRAKIEGSADAVAAFLKSTSLSSQLRPSS
ncbi:DNA mismatch endonuclease Vsr [Novosphingobium sp. BL-8A]|uniref:very short patch repair endonuclease n=1 Tax=Novosphingobium sp. BL-8A TaxID=3127639 RepID=UPI003757DADD